MSDIHTLLDIVKQLSDSFDQCDKIDYGCKAWNDVTCDIQEDVAVLKCKVDVLKNTIILIINILLQMLKEKR